MAHRPDVTLMDLQLPVMNGLQAIRAIKKADAGARVVVLTMYQGDEDIYRALQAGAVAYLLKDSVPDDLIRVIREVHAGNQIISDGVAAKLAARATQPALTDRELQVLELLAEGQ
jgi:two-component system NarL family response regulator